MKHLISGCDIHTIAYVKISLQKKKKKKLIFVLVYDNNIYKYTNGP